MTTIARHPAPAGSNCRRYGHNPFSARPRGSTPVRSAPCHSSLRWRECPTAATSTFTHRSSPLFARDQDLAITSPILPVVSIRRLLESTDFLHLGPDDRQEAPVRPTTTTPSARTASSGRGRPVLASGHDLSSSRRLTTWRRVQECVPSPGTRCQGGDSGPSTRVLTMSMSRRPASSPPTTSKSRPTRSLVAFRTVLRRPATNPSGPVRFGFQVGVRRHPIPADQRARHAAVG